MVGTRLDDDTGLGIPVRWYLEEAKGSGQRPRENPYSTSPRGRLHLESGGRMTSSTQGVTVSSVLLDRGSLVFRSD